MSQAVHKEKEVTLLDLLDRILTKGVILCGDITISWQMWTGLPGLESIVGLGRHCPADA
jgi:hypothetical protein